MSVPLELSVIVVTPYGFPAIRTLLRYLAEQTIRDLMEIVIVAPSRRELELDRHLLAAFGNFQVIEVGPID